MGDYIVSFAMVDIGKPGFAGLYTWTASATSRGGGLFAARVEGREINAVLPNKWTVSIKRRPERRLGVT